MRKMRTITAAALATICGWSLVSAASASQTYTDALGDNYGGPEVDISNVVISNDANNIYFTINMNPAANLTTNYFANYEVGIQTFGPAGQSAINGTYGTGNGAAGNPYGNSVGISTGENFFIGSFLAGPTYSGGAQLYAYQGAGPGWQQVGATAPATIIGTGTPSTSFSFPLSAFGFVPGNSFNFDVWTSFGSPQGAYDALDNTTGTPNTGGAPYSGGFYDSATAAGSTFATTIYTVTAPVPEPMSLGMVVGLAGMGLMRRRRAD
jgi:hypothetical protein